MFKETRENNIQNNPNHWKNLDFLQKSHVMFYFFGALIFLIGAFIADELENRIFSLLLFLCTAFKSLSDIAQITNKPALEQSMTKGMIFFFLITFIVGILNFGQ